MKGIARSLGVWDAVGIIVGIVVGTAIFRTPMLVFQNTTGPASALCVWLIGGLLCLIGAFCYAELATAWPRNGGDYEYLSCAYGRPVGFLFGWAQLSVILTGSIGAMAYAFADYATHLRSMPSWAVALTAAVVVFLLTLINLLGIVVGKTLQNVLSGVKILGLAAVVFTALAWGTGDPPVVDSPTKGVMGPGLGLALVFVLYAFGGWNDSVFVAAEVRDPGRNLPRALIGGIAGITLLYLAVNGAYLAVLGFDGARESFTPAADVVTRAVGPWGGRAVGILVMISALGAINGMILTGSRVYATLGQDHRLFAFLARWRSASCVPVYALIVQAAITIFLILLVGTATGRGGIDDLLGLAGIGAIPWERYYGGFETLVAGSAPVFWFFFLMTGISVIVLRIRNPERPRPFRVPFYPVTPLLFCGTCVYMLYSSLCYAKMLSLLGLIPLAAGVPLALLSSGNKGTE